MFINAGLNKFFFYIPVPEDLQEQTMKMFMDRSEITWLMPLLAIFQIIVACFSSFHSFVPSKEGEFRIFSLNA